MASKVVHLTVLILIFYTSALSQDLSFMLKDKNGTQYYNYFCGHRIALNERQQLSFYFPETIRNFRCYSDLNNHSVNITAEVLKFNRYITATVDEIFDGLWQCTVVTASGQQQLCVLNFEVIYDMQLTIQTPERDVLHTFPRGIQIGNAVKHETINFKEGDLFEFKCELPGVKSKTLKTGQLRWKGCEHNNPTECFFAPPVKINNMKTSSELDAELDNNTVSCVYTTASGLTTAIEVQLRLVDFVPPDFFATIGHVVTFVNDTCSYGGKPGEAVTAVCKSNESRRSVALRCCKSGLCATCAGGKLENNNASAVYQFNLTDSWNGMSLNCLYAETSSKGKMIEFDVATSSNLIQAKQQTEQSQQEQLPKQSQHTQKEPHAQQSSPTDQAQKADQTQQKDQLQQTVQTQQKDQSQHTVRPQQTHTQQIDQHPQYEQHKQSPQKSDAPRVNVKGHEPDSAETTDETSVYDVFSGEQILLQCNSSVNGSAVNLQCCQKDRNECSVCDDDDMVLRANGSVQYEVRLSNTNTSLIRFRCVYTEWSVWKTIVFRVHNTQVYPKNSAATVVVSVCATCILLAGAATAAALARRRCRARRSRPPLPAPAQSRLEPFYYTIAEAQEDLYYSYARPH